MPPTILFTPAKGNDFEIMITVLWGKTGDHDFNSQDKVRTFVEKYGQELLSNAAEPNIILQQIKGVTNTGYYFSITDKAPNPGEYRYMMGCPCSARQSKAQNSLASYGNHLPFFPEFDMTPVKSYIL